MRPKIVHVISDQQLAAHERDQRLMSDAMAIQWYRGQGAALPQLPDATLREQLLRAHETAIDIGLLDDEDDRLRRLLAFHALIPDPTGDQWLLAVDAVFDLPEASDAILRFKAIADGNP
jgi:hypothetical protein